MSFAALVLISIACCSRSEDIEHITILHTNDIQGRIRPDRGGEGGLARIAALGKKITSENPNTLLLDAGDAAAGTAPAAETRGEAVFHVMNAAGYDGMVLGNHEFDYGPEQVNRFIKIADFPILAANVTDRDGKIAADAACEVYSLGGVKIAVIGIANHRTPRLTTPDRISGLAFLDPEDSLRLYWKKHAPDVDLVIILSHLGLEEDEKLARRIEGTALIVGGHSETELRDLRRINDVRIAQAGRFGRYLGRVDVFFDAGKRQVVGWNSDLIPVMGNIKPDPEVEKAIMEQIEKVGTDIDRVIGKIRIPASRDWLGLWTAELIKAATEADYGVINRAAVRDEIRAGKITAADLYMVMPFDDEIVWVEMPGGDLEEFLGSRNLYVSSGPTPRKGLNYTVGTSDFLLKKSLLESSRKAHRTGRLVRDAMIERVEADQGFRSFWKK